MDAQAREQLGELDEKPDTSTLPSAEESGYVSNIVIPRGDIDN